MTNDWERARNVVIGATLGALLIWAIKGNAFGATWLAAIGGVLAVALGGLAIRMVRRSR